MFPGTALAVGSIPSHDTDKFVVRLTNLVIGSAPVRFGWVTVLVDWLFAPQGVPPISEESCCWEGGLGATNAGLMH